MGFSVKRAGVVDAAGFGRLGAVAEDEGMEIGRIEVAVTDDFADIHDVYVEYKYRQQGVANAMMAELFKMLTENEVKEMTLEVREGNFAAISLYEKYGFKTVHIRKRYYENGEDALLMRAEVLGDE